MVPRVYYSDSRHVFAHNTFKALFVMNMLHGSTHMQSESTRVKSTYTIQALGIKCTYTQSLSIYIHVWSKNLFTHNFIHYTIDT